MNNSHIPKVSVLMCVFNGERFLREAIESILSQTYEDFEFVIVDDGSGPAAREILFSYDDGRIRLITNPANIGLTKSLNIGLAACHGEYVARMDADDVSHPERLKNQVVFLDEHQDIAVLGTQVRYINDNGNIVRSSTSRKGTNPLVTRWQFLFDSPVTHSASMFRRTIIADEFGGYDERFVTSQDYELWSRVMSKYQITNMAEELVDFRCHAESVSRKYIPDYVNKIGVLFQKNLSFTIGEHQLLSDFGQNWVTITNPSILPPLNDNIHVIKQLDYIYEVFREHFYIICGSELDKTIRECLADKYYLICYNSSNHDKKAAIKCIGKYISCKGLLSVKVLAMFVMLVFGRNGMNLLRRLIL